MEKLVLTIKSKPIFPFFILDVLPSGIFLCQRGPPTPLGDTFCYCENTNSKIASENKWLWYNSNVEILKKYGANDVLIC